MEPFRTESLHARVLKAISDHKSGGFSLRMAPMIDIIFLLLIFFLVAANWRPEESFLPFHLPSAKAQSPSIGKPEPLMIYIFAIDSGCQVQISQFEPVKIEKQNIEADLAGLMEQMNISLRAQKRFASDPIEIICHPAVKWQYLAKIYNVFYGGGLTDITFIMTEQPNDGNFD